MKTWLCVCLGLAVLLPRPALAIASCEERLVLCIDLDGDPYLDKKSVLRVGDKVLVKVYGPASAIGTVSIEARAAIARNTVLPTRPRAAPGVNGAPEPGPTLVFSQLIEIEDTDEISLHLSSGAEDDKQPGVITLRVDRGLYFARAGLSFFYVPDGRHEITPDYVVMEDAAQIAGVALSIWPWGHRARSLSFLEQRAWGDSFADLFFVQVGTDLDFSAPFDRAFVGVGLEPVSGVGISVGLAMVTGEFLSGADADSSDVTDERWMLRGYAALSLTTEFMESLKKLAASDD